jgi:Ca-activated chloride channel family protein
MVVAPRFNPGAPTGRLGTGRAADTTQVPDASRISPPLAPPGTRAGHDLSLAVTIDSPEGVSDVRSVLHEVEIAPQGPDRVRVALKNNDEIPNKDFILNWRPKSPNVSEAFYVHGDERGEFFTLVLQPPARVTPEQAVPKEMIFVIDRSGSMRGAPIEKAKEAMKLCIEGMNPNDTFNLLSFSNSVEDYMGGSVPNTPENRALALEKLAALAGGGGTNMVPSLQQALGGEPDPDRVRIVCFMTDGQVGNEADVLETVQTNIERGRIFAFGVGNSVNRYLLEKLAAVGRGDVEFVALADPADPAAQRFAQRIQSPVLTDIRIDWGDLAVEEVYPDQIPDVFSRTPIMVHGRLKGAAGGTITLHGQTATGPYEQRIAVRPTQDRTPHEVIPTLWARAKVADLMLMQPVGRGDPSLAGQIRDEIVSVGVKYRIMTEYTSFVAVEEMTVTVAGEPMTIAVPVEMPEGVSYEGVFGTESGRSMAKSLMSQGAGYGAFYSLNGALGSSIGSGGGGRGGRRGAQALDEFRSRGETLDRAARASVAQPTFAPTPRPILRQQSERLAEGVTFDYDGNANNLLFADLQAGIETSPTLKLAEPLRTLAAHVERDGREGNLTVGKLKVVAYRIDVMITLRDLSDETLKALADLGFVRTAESRATRLLVGAIDVRKLEELAKLEAVRSVEAAAR